MWSETFEAGSPLHLIVASLCLGVMAGASILGARWRRRAPLRERALRIAWIALLIPFQIASVGYWFLPGNYDITVSLPIQLCDLVVWLAPLGLLCTWRWPRTLLYFLGIGLSAWAFFAPVLRKGPASPVFWLFWIGHVQIVGTGVYVAAAMGYRPRLRDVVVATGAGVAYLAVILPFDILTGLDYGYVGRETTSVVGALGPWPLRVVLLVPLVCTVFVLLWVPWAAAARWSPASEAETADT
ncbi:MAG: TIGR02206 family membrane protein [Phycisphaerales bacterium]|nr:TIGR02206 family membrane protein [Phycisphaerales bacterium]